MSKDGTRAHSLSLSSNGVEHHITIDGTDYSRSVRSVTLELGPAGQPPRAIIEPLVMTVEQTDLEQAELVIGHNVTDMLVSLGYALVPVDALESSLVSSHQPRSAPRRRRWWFNYNPQARPPARLLLHTLAEPRAAAYALLLRLACRACAHNRSCWGNPACPRHGRRKR